jgi:hypothetical protein
MKCSPTHDSRLLLTGLALVLCASCASGERFGDAAGGGAGAGVECFESSDCWDGDPATEDACTPQGECVFLANVKADAEKDAEEIENDCHAIAEVIGDSAIDAEMGMLTPEAVHSAPTEYATLYKITVSARSRLEVMLEDAGAERVMFVLLTDCTNACKNRIAWGRELCSPVLDPGGYFLAVYSERMYEFGFTADFLSPEDSCNGLDVAVDC